jgi:polysaccharide chain length determinant protein (PEP-CTERM system associated)
MDEQIEKGANLEWLKAVWQRRKFLALAAFIMGLALFFGVAAFLPDIYLATATVLVDQEQVRQDQLRDISGKAAALPAEVETRLQTINQQVLSRARLQEAILRFNPYPRLRDRVPIEEIVDVMRRDIRLELKNVEQEPGHRATVAFALSFQGRDPKTAALVTNALANYFVAENEKLRGQQATETAAFLKTQLEEMKKKLDAQEAKVAGIRGLDAGGSALVTYERMGDQLRLNSERMARASDRREVLSKQLSELDPNGDPRSRSEYLGKLRRDLNELQSRLTDKHPDVIRAQNEIAALESGAGDLKSGTKAKTGASSDPTVQKVRSELREVEAEIAGLRQESKNLQGNIAGYQRKLEAARESPEAIRDYEATKELYSSLLKRYAEAQQSQHVEQSQKGEKFRILDSALPPKDPEAPNRLLLKLLGLVFSIGLAVAAVMAAEQIDPSFHTVDHLRSFTKVPVLASIRRIVTATDRASERRRLGLRIAAATAGAIMMIGVSYYFAHDNEGLVRKVSRKPAAETPAR